ncbi:MAG: hypothetical protein ABJB61_15195 [bacterium]
MPDALAKNFSNAAPSPWLNWLGPFLLAVLGAYGTVSYAAGDLTRRLTTVEKQTSRQEEEHKRFVTREEQQIFIDSTSRELREIHEDVRAIRSSVEKK